jgi:hypothetical protein
MDSTQAETVEDRSELTMVTETTTRIYDSAASAYLGWLDASLAAQERAAKVARSWIDEALGAQQDMTEAAKKALVETQSAFTPQQDEPATPLTFMNRAGELARSNYALWAETGLKAQERLTRVAQLAFAELRNAQAEATTKAKK